MIFLKKCLIYLRLLWYGLFQGFKSVDDLITKNQKEWFLNHSFFVIY